MVTTLICPNCTGKIKFSQEEIKELFDQCNNLYLLKTNLLKTPECPHCHTNFDEMTHPCFKSTT